MKNNKNRREVLKNLALGTGAIGFGGLLTSFESLELQNGTVEKPLKNNIRHSVCRWTFSGMPLEKFAQICADLGITGMDLLKPSEWEAVEKYGLQCSMATDDFASITDGFNDPKNHKKLQNSYRGLIDKASEKGIKNVICFSGNKRELDKETGIENCAIGLTPLVKYAENKDVFLVMELLNSKDHIDYQCDHTEWGVALAEKMGLPNFKLLYDIYHMQRMEGDVIHTIKKYHQYINHYHTAGVPGRHEIDETQELFYPAIMRGILETGFDGYVAQEFIPTQPDKIASLKEAIAICDV